MRDLLLGRPVTGLGGFPFEPVSTAGVNGSAASLGIAIHPRGNVHALPLIGHFVGADTLGYLSEGGMLSCLTTPPANFCTACFSGNYRVLDEEHRAGIVAKEER